MMKTGSKAFLGMAGVVCGLASAEPVDGFRWNTPYWALEALCPQYWEGGTLPQDGGVAYLTGTGSSSFTFSSARTWRGIDFGQTKISNGKPSLAGGKLTLAHDAFLGGTGQGTGTSGWDIFAAVSSTISGTGANTLTKRDLGILRLDTPAPFANFGTVAAGGGFLRASPFSSALFAPAGTTLAVRGGTFEWTPATNASSKAASATMGATTYGRYGGSLAWAKGLNDSATLTLASLAPEDAAGATLALEPSGGAAALGEAEKLLVTAPPAMVNGILDPGIVVREKDVESAPFRFTRYDDEKGVVPYPVSSMKDLVAAGESDVAVVTATNTLEASKHVAALSIENTARLTLSNDVTLTVGDGTHAAGVIFNTQSRLGNDANYLFAGAGTLDFGTSPGVLWASSPSFISSTEWGGNRVFVLNTRITGSAGVTFASRTRDNTTYGAGCFTLRDVAAAWTGPTYVCGALLWVGNGSKLPAGDLYILNGSGLGGTLRFDSACSLSQNLHLAGRGCFGDSPGALHLADGYSTLAGTVTLEDDTWLGFRHSGKGGVLFRGAVKGPGSLILAMAGTHNFYATNTFADLRVTAAGTAINLVTNGTFGTGRVWVRANNLALGVSEAQNAVITNRFRCESPVGSLVLRHAAVTLDTDVTASQTTFTNFSSLAVGGTVDLGDFTASGARDTQARTFYSDTANKISYTTWLKPEAITAARAGAEVRIGAAADRVLAVPLEDGAGTLALTKKGAGTLEIPAGPAHAYSGATKVAAGTLRLNDDPLASKSLVWWLDASREQDFDKAADGTVTNWHPRAGSAGVTFKAVGTNPTWNTYTVNGLPVVTMGDRTTQLKGDRKAWHRTVFQVCRMREPMSLACTFGAPTTEFNEYGIRLNGSAFGSPWELDKVAHYICNTTGKGRINGQTSTMACTADVQIITTFHDRDNWNPSIYWGQATRTPYFTPMLNYYGWSRPFLGDYAEVIAFDRVLSETEVRRVENYLAEKWLGKKFWTDAQLAAPAVLPAATALDVATDATLDLNGTSVTVASLTGNGTITNSAATPATLTVTGSASFTGRVGGAVTLATAGTAALGAVATEGATLAATGGTLATGTHAFTPSTEGLAYWCDAGRPETILCNESGAVTSWLSRAASTASALVNTGGKMPPTTSTKAKPVFNADTATALDGRPGIYYANERRSLWADVKSPVRTVFAVAMVCTNQNNCNGLWGVAGLDCGFRFNSKSTTLEDAGSVVRPTVRSDRVRMDGLTTFAFGLNKVRVFSARLESTNAAYFAQIGLEAPTPSRTTVLGDYSGNPALEGYVGEVIAYNRVLSDGEMLQVEQYLANKWQKTAWTDGEPPAETTGTFAGGALAVGAGAAATVPDGTNVGTLSGGGTLSGDVTAEGFDVTVKADGTTDTLTVDGTLTLGAASYLNVLNQDNLAGGVYDTFVRATSIAGRFAGTNLVKPNGYNLSSTEGKVYHAAGCCLIVR